MPIFVFQHREAVRKTYGSIREMYGFRIRTIFVMGLPHEDELAEKSAVFNEAAQYGDLLIGNFSDHYRNNTYKVNILCNLYLSTKIWMIDINTDTMKMS